LNEIPSSLTNSEAWKDKIQLNKDESLEQEESLKLTQERFKTYFQG